MLPLHVQKIIPCSVSALKLPWVQIKYAIFILFKLQSCPTKFIQKHLDACIGNPKHNSHPHGLRTSARIATLLDTDPLIYLRSQRSTSFSRERSNYMRATLHVQPPKSSGLYLKIFTFINVNNIHTHKI